MKREDKLLFVRIFEDFSNEAIELNKLSNKIMHISLLMSENAMRIHAGQPIDTSKVKTELSEVSKLLRYQGLKWDALIRGIDELNESL